MNLWSIIIVIAVAAIIGWAIYTSARTISDLGQAIKQPMCFGSEPGLQQIAKNDCHTCAHAHRCVPERFFYVG